MSNKVLRNFWIENFKFIFPKFFDLIPRLLMNLLGKQFRFKFHQAQRFDRFREIHAQWGARTRKSHHRQREKYSIFREKNFSYALRIEREATRTLFVSQRKPKVYKSSEKLMFMCKSCLCFAYETMKNKWLYDVTWMKLAKYLFSLRTETSELSMLKIPLDIKMRSEM